MATAPQRSQARKVDYPTRDGKPMAETEIHRDDMMDLTQTLKYQFAEDPMVCASGNMLMFYEEENRRKHVSPDVFFVRGIPKKQRDELPDLGGREGAGPGDRAHLEVDEAKRPEHKMGALSRCPAGG